MDTFEVIEVDAPVNVEHQGTKSKFWFRKNDQMYLFKEGKIQGENWAELIASELAKGIELPSALYFPATFKGRKGVATPSFVSEQGRLISANELFFKIDRKGEDINAKKREYRLTTSLTLLELLHKNIDAFESTIPDIEPVDTLVGYLMFDFLIGNQDRHEENWGLLLEDQSLSLAPSFDHASSLACRELPETRKKRLTTKDTNYGIEAFLNRSKTLFYTPDNKRMKNLDALLFLKKTKPKTFEYWKNKMSALTKDRIKGIVSSIPQDWMTDIEKEFTIRLIELNLNTLLNLEYPQNV